MSYDVPSPEIEDDQGSEISPLNRKPGRKPGISNEDCLIRHWINLQECEDKLIKEGARRSDRLKEKAEVTLNVKDSKYIPQSYEEATNSDCSKEWHEEMEKELQLLKLHNIWKLVPRTDDMKVIKSKWIYNIEFNPNGLIERRKARLVAMGCYQRPGIDYNESFSPVMKMESLRTLIALAAKHNLEIHHFDVQSAYLYEDLKETIFMEQPPRFIKGGEENQVCQLQKSLNGLPQSGKNWNEKFKKVLTNIGLHRLDSDPCTNLKIQTSL